MSIDIKKQIHQSAQDLLDNKEEDFTITVRFNREAIDAMQDADSGTDIVDIEAKGVFMLARKILEEYFILKDMDADKVGETD